MSAYISEKSYSSLECGLCITPFNSDRSPFKKSQPSLCIFLLFFFLFLRFLYATVPLTLLVKQSVSTTGGRPRLENDNNDIHSNINIVLKLTLSSSDGRDSGPLQRCSCTITNHYATTPAAPQRAATT